MCVWLREHKSLAPPFEQYRLLVESKSPHWWKYDVSFIVKEKCFSRNWCLSQWSNTVDMQYRFAVVWLVCSEIFPSSVKGRAVSITGAVNWIVNILVSFTFLDYVGKLTASLDILVLSKQSKLSPVLRSITGFSRLFKHDGSHINVTCRCTKILSCIIVGSSYA